MEIIQTHYFPVRLNGNVAGGTQQAIKLMRSFLKSTIPLGNAAGKRFNRPIVLFMYAETVEPSRKTRAP